MSGSELKDQLSELNSGRPRTLKDFDLFLAIQSPAKRESRPERLVWSSARWINGIFLLILVGMCPTILTAYWSRAALIDRIRASPFPGVVVSVVLVLVSTGLLLVSGYLALRSDRLVVDRVKREFRIHRGLPFKPPFVLPFRNIRALCYQPFDTEDADGVSFTHHLLMAELEDGQLASIALQSEDDKGQMYNEIRNALA